MFLLYEFIVWFGTLNQQYQDIRYWWSNHLEVYHESSYYYSYKNYGDRQLMLTVKFKDKHEDWWYRYRYFDINMEDRQWPEVIDVGGVFFLVDNYGDLIVFGDIYPSDENNVQIVDEQANTLYAGRVPIGFIEKMMHFIGKGRE